MISIIFILTAYLIGSIPTAYLVGRITKKIDIRHYGSHNVGASNIWAHVGKRATIIVGAFDFLVKGSIPVYLTQSLCDTTWLSALVGLGLVIGHNWSAYIKFSGGRGILVTGGVLLILAWKELLILLAIAITGWIITKSSAMWVAIAMLSLPIWTIVFNEPTEITIISIALLLVTALKRVIGNPTNKSSTHLKNVFLHRLIYDRDIANREQWINDTPDNPPIPPDDKT